MERKDTIVLVEKKGIGGTTSFGTAVRSNELRPMPIVPFTDDQDLHRPAPKVACAEVDGIIIWEGFQGIQFHDPNQSSDEDNRKEVLLGYHCPIQYRVAQFARSLELHIYKGGLAGDGQISTDDLKLEDTVTHFPNLFQNRQ